MGKICQKCGKEYDDNLLNCPYCEQESNQESLEVIEPIVETPKVEELVTTPVETKEIETIEEVIDTPIVEPVKEVVQSEVAPVVESTPIVVETPAVEPVQEVSQPEVVPVVESTPVIVEALAVEPVQEVSQPEVAPVVESTPVIVEAPAVEKHNIEEIETIEDVPSLTEIAQPAESLPQVEPIVEEPAQPEAPKLDMPTLDDIHPTNTTDGILENIDKEVQPEPVLKAESSGLESVNLEEVSVLVDEHSLEPKVENEEIESVSISASKESLEVKEEEFVIPEMPAPSVGEINPELLGNKYDADEAINNQKIEVKKQQDAMEMERIRQEAVAKSQMPMEKPDLLARIPDPEAQDVELSAPKKKGKPMRKVLNVIIVILAIAVAGAAVWYFFFQGKEDANKENYMEPIETYITGYRDADASKMLSAFVPCVAKSEEISLMITNIISTRNQYKELQVEFSEKSAEVVNGSDQQSLNEYLKNTCGSEAPTIKEYKQVYVEQKIKTEQDKDFAVENPKFWNVMIDEKWYILMVE